MRLPAHLKRTTSKRPTGKESKPAETAASEVAADVQPEAITAFLETQYKVGDPVQARVLRIDEEQRRIALSLKRV